MNSMVSDFSPRGGRRPARLPASAPVPLAASQAAQVDHHGDDQDDHIRPGQRHVRVHHPGVGQGGERQKKKPSSGMSRP